MIVRRENRPANLASQLMAAGIDLAVDDDAHADSRAGGHAQEMTMPSAGPAEQFGQGERANVLLDEDRTIEVRSKMIEQRDILEVGQQVVEHDAAQPAIDLPRRGNAESEQPPSLRLFRRLLRRVHDDLQYGLSAKASLETDLLLSHNFSSEVGQYRPHAQSLEIHSQEVAVIGVQPHRHRRAAPPGRPDVVLDQQALSRRSST